MLDNFLKETAEEGHFTGLGREKAITKKEVGSIKL
jgi:hypothetical protein